MTGRHASIKTASAYLQVSERQIRRLIKTGKLKATKGTIRVARTVTVVDEESLVAELGRRLELEGRYHQDDPY